MRLVTFTNTDGSSVGTIAVSAHEMRHVANILEDSSHVHQFKLDGGSTQKDFGFGGYTKWVSQFTWDHLKG